MLEPYRNAADLSFAREMEPDVDFVARQRSPDWCHPLTRIHRIVDSVCTPTVRPIDAQRRHSVDTRVVRAAVLQSLYSFGRNELLIEHLRYNALYRWFVGLQDNECPWNASSFEDALNRVLTSPEGAGVLLTALSQAQSCAALSPDRFCIDRTLIQRWTSLQAESLTGRANTSATTSDQSRARLDRARSIILRRIADHSLTPESIADEMCMSRRALFMLFEKHGLTPKRAIRDLRLDHCRKLLADERHRQRKITDIAMDFGFAHPGTFSRQFKDRFGVSPIEVRSGARAAG